MKIYRGGLLCRIHLEWNERSLKIKLKIAPKKAPKLPLNLNIIRVRQKYREKYREKTRRNEDIFRGCQDYRQNYRHFQNSNVCESNYCYRHYHICLVLVAPITDIIGATQFFPSFGGR